MRIALVTDTYTPQVNGVTTLVRRVVEVLGRARQHAAVVAPEYPAKDPGLAEAELRVPSLAFPPYPAIRLSLPQARRVAHFLDAFRPDLVHVMTEGPLGVLGRRHALRRGLPLVTSFHTDFPRYSRSYGVGALEPAIWRWLTWFHSPARFVHTPGEAVRSELMRRGLADVRVWGRGVDTGRFDHRRRDPSLRHRLGAPPGSVVVLHVGRLAPEKNLDVLVAAWALAHEQLGHARFVVAGEGPVARRCAAAMPWALQLGFLEVPLLAALYASADLCVLPSRTETCGLVALEAMASGLPVVAAAAGGFRESVVDGVTGFLVPPDDVRGFAAAIGRLAHDAALRRRMSEDARLAAVARHADAEDEQLLDDYAHAIGGNASEDLQWRAA